MYFMVVTFPTLFPKHYGFNEGEVGLAYLGQGVGFVLAQLVLSQTSDWYVKRQQALHGSARPEDRLPLVIIGCGVIAIGMFWYGWSIQARAHWIVPIMGTAVMAMGILFMFISVQLYLVDAFPSFAASAIAVAVTMRSVLGALLPLAAPSMYERLGYGWGNSLLAFIILGLAPVAFLLFKYGEDLRGRTKLPVDF